MKKFWKDLGTRRWLLLLAAGLLLVVITMPSGRDNGQDRFGAGADREGESTGISDWPAEGDFRLGEYERKLEKRLTEILSQVEGAGQVKVMLTLKTSSEQMLQSDTSRQEKIVQETDAQGGVRDNAEQSENSKTVLAGRSGSAEPYVVGERMPRVEGVVVACEGGDRPLIQAEISAAIQALFDLQPHKIKVCKMASQ